LTTEGIPGLCIPIPRGAKPVESDNPDSASGGYEFFLGQFADHQIHFTPLISYKQHQENSPPCLTI